MPCLTTSLRYSSDVKEQTKQVCQCTGRSVSVKGDAKRYSRTPTQWKPVEQRKFRNEDVGV